MIIFSQQIILLTNLHVCGYIMHYRLLTMHTIIALTQYKLYIEV